MVDAWAEARSRIQTQMWTPAGKESAMDTASVRRSKLLQQVKRGRMGATQWTRLFVMLVAAGEMFNVVSDAHRGKGNFSLLASAIVMIFILAIAGIGLGALDMNERFAALIQLIGEDKLLQGKE
jgi:hypothetical protein